MACPPRWVWRTASIKFESGFFVEKGERWLTFRLIRNSNHRKLSPIPNGRKFTFSPSLRCCLNLSRGISCPKIKSVSLIGLSFPSCLSFSGFGMNFFNRFFGDNQVKINLAIRQGGLWLLSSFCPYWWGAVLGRSDYVVGVFYSLILVCLYLIWSSVYSIVFDTLISFVSVLSSEFSTTPYYHLTYLREFCCRFW